MDTGKLKWQIESRQKEGKKTGGGKWMGGGEIG